MVKEVNNVVILRDKVSIHTTHGLSVILGKRKICFEAPEENWKKLKYWKEIKKDRYNRLRSTRNRKSILQTHTTILTLLHLCSVYMLLWAMMDMWLASLPDDDEDEDVDWTSPEPQV